MFRNALAALAASVMVAAPANAIVYYHPAPHVYAHPYYHAPVVVAPHPYYGYHAPYYHPPVVVVPRPRVLHCGYNMFGQRICRVY